MFYKSKLRAESSMKYLKILLILILAFSLAGCASSKQNPYAKKRKKSHITQSQLGRNKYFYSTSYQKKLRKSYNKKRY